jgi:hypothetical protein
MTKLYHAVRVDRTNENAYEITDNHSRTIKVSIKDHHLLHLARMLGFEQWYPNLDEHLELSTETFIGTILLDPAYQTPPPIPHLWEGDQGKDC